jgi:hypothetical protein
LSEAEVDATPDTGDASGCAIYGPFRSDEGGDASKPLLRFTTHSAPVCESLLNGWISLDLRVEPAVVCLCRINEVNHPPPSRFAFNVLVEYFPYQPRDTLLKPYLNRFPRYPSK